MLTNLYVFCKMTISSRQYMALSHFYLSSSDDNNKDLGLSYYALGFAVRSNPIAIY